MNYLLKCAFCDNQKNVFVNGPLFLCGLCFNYNFIHECTALKSCVNLFYSRFCSNCGEDISAYDNRSSLIKPSDDFLPKFSFSNSNRGGLLELFVLNKKPLIRFSKSNLFFFLKVKMFY